jgi:hypothetical protein
MSKDPMDGQWTDANIILVVDYINVIVFINECNWQITHNSGKRNIVRNR